MVVIAQLRFISGKCQVRILDGELVVLVEIFVVSLRNFKQVEMFPLTN